MHVFGLKNVYSTVWKGHFISVFLIFYFVCSLFKLLS